MCVKKRRSEAVCVSVCVMSILKALISTTNKTSKLRSGVAPLQLQTRGVRIASIFGSVHGPQTPRAQKTNIKLICVDKILLTSPQGN